MLTTPPRKGGVFALEGFVTMAGHVVSVLKRATSKDVKTEPFPYLSIEGALLRDYYRLLASSFPGRRLMLDGQVRPQNISIAYSGIEAFITPEIYPPEWAAFMRYHMSDAFFRDIINLFGKHFRARYPDFEQRMGKKFEQMTVGPRASDATWDIRLDCQFGVNTPVTTPSSVRGPHIDANTKLFNALLYLRPDGDDSTGGDFEIYKVGDAPIKYGARGDAYGVPDELVQPVKTVPYRANNLVLFLNSPTSVHGVTPRGVTSVPRQFINFLAECTIPVFPFTVKQECAFVGAQAMY
jgi:hypothetical protein